MGLNPALAGCNQALTSNANTRARMAIIGLKTRADMKRHRITVPPK
jgi:hypothetical protein